MARTSTIINIYIYMYVCIMIYLFISTKPYLNKELSSRYLNAIQTNAPHLLRYLATALIVNKRRRTQFKDFIKVIQQEQYGFKDPIAEFLACVYVNYDFDGAQKKMRECEEVSFMYFIEV